MNWNNSQVPISQVFHYQLTWIFKKNILLSVHNTKNYLNIKQNLQQIKLYSVALVYYNIIIIRLISWVHQIHAHNSDLKKKIFHTNVSTVTWSKKNYAKILY